METQPDTYILVPKCLNCHNPSGTRRSEDFTDYTSTLSTGKVEPGDPLGSALYAECFTGDMPKGGSPLSDAELSAIYDWILEGAQDN